MIVVSQNFHTNKNISLEVKINGKTVNEKLKKLMM